LLKDRGVWPRKFDTWATYGSCHWLARYRKTDIITDDWIVGRKAGVVA
jgi:hypothetical protein